MVGSDGRPDHGAMPMRLPSLPMQASAAGSRYPHPTTPEARMNPLLNRLCRKAPLPQPLPATMLLATAADTGAAPAGPGVPAVPVEPVGPGACGWFDSSLDLRQGLAVSEVRDTDWTVLVLWFGPAALRGSARLQ